MSNLFLDIVRKANELNWCVNPYCTTCLAKDYRYELRGVGGEFAGPLFDALKDVSFDELMSIPNWAGALEIAIRDLPLPGQASILLETWLERASDHIRFFDVVLFRFVRYLSNDNALRKRWVSKGIQLAKKNEDFSLTESLIITMRDEALLHKELMDLAIKFAESSTQMQRVLFNICSIRTGSA